MTDVLGVAASVAGLMTIADAIVRKGFKFIKDVKDAEKSVEKLVEEVNNLSGVLHSLNNVVERLEEDEENVDPSTQIHYIESCYKTLMKIQGHFDEAVPATPMSRGDKLRWPLKKSHTKELLVEIERHKATMTLAMTAREMTALLEILARQEGIRDGIQDIRLSLEADRAERRKLVISEERRKMLNLLGDVDARKWQDSNIRLRQPSTGVWFTDGAEFKNWLSTDESKLWINGIPGAGKTILISSIIQEIEKRVECSHALAFFYCDYKDPQTHDPLNILGALARQLILQDERCFALLTRFCEDIPMNQELFRCNTPEEKLCELIKNSSRYFQTTMIIVDGLDEITNNRADVTRLLSSLNTEGGQIKTLFASRPEVDIGYELEDFVQVPIAAMSSDLRLYVASEIERRTRERKLRIRDPSLKDHIMKTLVEGADGMFRWVACQMDYLCECNNDRDRREALKKLPPDLPSSYERILERVNRSSKENQDLVKRTLHWIVYARRDWGIRFGMEELLQALAMRDGENFFDQHSMPCEEDVLHWCSSLVRKNTLTTRLELAHFTVEEFLEAIDPIQKPSFEQYQLADDHTILAKECLNILRCQKFDGSLRPRIDSANEVEVGQTWVRFAEDHPFMRYSCLNWSHHVHRSNWDDIAADVWDIFCSEDTFRFWTFAWLFEQGAVMFHPPYHFEKPDAPTILHWAALFALDKLGPTFIESRLNVSQQSIMGTPLYCAMLYDCAILGYDHSSEFKEWAYVSVRKNVREAPARENMFRQLVEAGPDLDMAIDPRGQRRALTIALEMEKFGQETSFRVSALIDMGARLSQEDFFLLRNRLEKGLGLEETQSIPPDTRVCYISMSRLVTAVTKGGWKGLMPGAEFEFFSLILSAVSRGWPIDGLKPFLQIRFSEVFLEPFGSELDDIIHDESESWQSRVITFLSKAIRNSFITTGQVIATLQKSLNEAVRRGNVSIVSLLLEHNCDLIVSRINSIYNGRTLLHRLSELGFHETGIDASITQLILHGVNVAHPDEGGVTAALHLSPKLIGSILSSAIRSGNQHVKEFLIQELFESNIMPNVSVLEVVVCLETPDRLEVFLGQEQELDHHPVTDEFLEKRNEEGESHYVAIETAIEKTESTARELEALYLATQPLGTTGNFAFLVERGVQTSHRYQHGNTIMHILARNLDNNSFIKLQFLLRADRRLDILNDASLTPLALAMRSRNMRGMELLLDTGANPDITLRENQTVLHMACSYGNMEAVKSLLGHGCQTSQKNTQGLTAKEVAWSSGYVDIATIVQNEIDRNSSAIGDHQNAGTALSTSAQTEDHENLPLRGVGGHSPPGTSLKPDTNESD